MRSLSVTRLTLHSSRWRPGREGSDRLSPGCRNGFRRPNGSDSSPRLIYSKSFPGSNPAWEEITVDNSGAGLYKDDPKDENPLKFQLTDAEKSEMFGLSDKLDHFSHRLESGLKVANMGMKTLRYEAGAQSLARSNSITPKIWTLKR